MQDRAPISDSRGDRAISQDVDILLALTHLRIWAMPKLLFIRIRINVPIGRPHAFYRRRAIFGVGATVG